MCLIENISLIYINLFVMRLKNINNITINIYNYDTALKKIYQQKMITKYYYKN